MSQYYYKLARRLITTNAVFVLAAIALMKSVQFYSLTTTARVLVKGEKLHAISHPCKLACQFAAADL